MVHSHDFFYIQKFLLYFSLSDGTFCCVWLLLSSWEIIASGWYMTALLPYGTGICHYAFGYFSVFLFLFLLWFFNCFCPVVFVFF